MKVKRENKDYPCARSVGVLPHRNRCKTHTESDGDQWKSSIRDSAKDLGGLATDGKSEQDTRGSVQVTVAGGEGTGEDSGIDDVWEDLDSSSVNGDDIWTGETMVRSSTRHNRPRINSPLGSITSIAQQVRIVIGYEHTSDQYTENLSRIMSSMQYEHKGCSGAYVENKDTPEGPRNGLADVPPWALGLGSGAKECRISHTYIFPYGPSRYAHGDELHSLETEGSLGSDRQNS